MAYVTHPQTSILSGFRAGISRFFAAVGRGMMMSAASEARMRQVDKLNAKSDAELAKMGLRRQDIAAHVFRDLMHI